MDSHTPHHPFESADVEREIRLVRDAMNRGTDTLEPPADLLHGVLVIGHRKRVRARVAAVLGTGLGVAALALGAFLVVDPDRATATGPASRPSASPTATVAAQRGAPIEVVSRPSPSGTVGPSRSAGERDWSDDYRLRVAEALRDLLPATIGRVRIVEGAGPGFDGITVEGRIFPLTFAVHRAAGASAERSCDGSKGVPCVADRLPGAVPVVVHVLPRSGGSATSVEASFHVGDSNVTVTVGADEATDTSAPVDPQQLLAFVRDPRVLQLVGEADRRASPSSSSTATVSPTS
ncbi:hypothetical protein [Streptomyces sp. SID3343]|uniref:hypothetical protein n=1 Tax=Streptomyces sp. SID3343 TaxID=2690260 RepID=UPI0013717DF1|nr:hypothetical protein [Streptomyces sp. SID3343]MYW00348.1 hypothetical protein [Streptomyces sp. SID3343]